MQELTEGVYMAGRPNSKWLETMIAKHGSREAVSEIQRAKGSKGGAASNTGGFADKSTCYCQEVPYHHFKAQCAGSKGGRVSRRTKTVVAEPVVQKKKLFGIF